MTPVERLQAAIEKLERHKAEAFPGPWEILTSGVEGGDHWYVMSDHSAILYISANDGSDEELRRPTAALIAMLHRTIDAQIAIIRNVLERYAKLELPDEWVPRGPTSVAVLALADAILGVDS